ncbi:MAG: c-type cytochrome [Chloroflexi bacterium]|nr:c-type cytochrome [Chloroflexota bacterium]
MRLRHRITFIGIAALLTLAIACTSGESTPFPTAEPAATSTPVPADDHADDDDGHDEDEAHEAESALDAVDRGRVVYQQVGCAACHGEDGSGTVIAPGLPGHNELQVRRQVRGPIGVMPVFGTDVLTPEDLSALVAYVESLSGAHMHGMETGIPLAEQSLAHHRMALTAFSADNVDEAEHHIEHLIGILDGQHLALMQEALDLTLSGDIHDAQHMIEGMLSDVQPADESFVTLHFKLGLAGLRATGNGEAAHHLEHAAAVADGDELAEINEILALLAADEKIEAEEHLSALLGMASIGIGNGGHDDADAAHEDDDDHATDDQDADATHEDDDDHATDDQDADATHEDGDEHATGDQDADAMHEDGDEHATGDQDADATHEDGDEHATDEHDADALHEDGDEHATDEHDADADPAA